MLNDKKYTITLGDFDIGQMLDGIRERAQEYRNTERYHETGECDPLGSILEVNDAHEARTLAEHYESIVAIIHAQMKEQDARG
jgi:hypothetical protein